MKINYKQASQLCNANEFRLIEQSRPNNLAPLNLREAKRREGQARNQFDKWRELSIKQDRKGGKADQAQERTRAKRDLFREVLNRFEARRKKLESAEAAGNRKRAAAKMPDVKAQKRPFSAKPASVSPAKGAPSASASTAPGRTQRSRSRRRITEQRIAQSGLTTRVRGHVSARGRRAQARRNVR